MLIIQRSWVRNYRWSELNLYIFLYELFKRNWIFLLINSLRIQVYVKYLKSNLYLEIILIYPIFFSCALWRLKLILVQNRAVTKLGLVYSTLESLTLWIYWTILEYLHGCINLFLLRLLKGNISTEFLYLIILIGNFRMS